MSSDEQSDVYAAGARSPESRLGEAHGWGIKPSGQTWQWFAYVGEARRNGQADGRFGATIEARAALVELKAEAAWRAVDRRP